MLGKGAKRKLDEDEEGLEGKALAVLSGVASSAGVGPEGPVGGASKGVSYTLQRQTIFNISLLKLYSQRALSEPSLQRRVLINNMLRRIQDELKQEGALRPLPFPVPPPVPMPSPAAPHDHHPLDEGFRQASSSPTPAANASFGMLSATGSGSAAVNQGSPANGLALQPSPQACLTPASLLEEDAGAFGALPPPPAPSLVPPSTTPSSSSSSSSPLLLGAPCRPLRDSFSSALDEIEELCPSAVAATTTTHTTTSPSPSPSPLSVSSVSFTPSSLSASSLHLPLSPPALVPSLALSSLPDSKDCGKADSPKPDVVPMEVVLPAAELEMSTSSSSCTSSSSSSSFSSSSPSSCAAASATSSGFLTDLALDDILFADIDTSMYDFDPCTTASGGGTGASKLAPVVTADDLLKTLSSPGVTPNQPFKMDLTELDHIMEVLVGS